MALIHEKIVEVLTAVGAVGKNEENKEQKFSYRGVDSVVNAVNPHLKAAGVFIAHEVLSHDLDRFENANKKIVTNVKVRVKYTWYAADGTFVENVAIGEGRDFADKASAKAMSVAFRTHLLQLLALPTNDRDPDAESIEMDAAPTQAPAAPKAHTVADLQKQVRDIIANPDLAGYDSDTINALGATFSGGKPGNVWNKDAKVLTQIIEAVGKGELPS
jgi:ribosomal protein L31E